MGQLYINVGDFKTAKPYIVRANNLYPEEVIGNRFYAIVLSRLGDHRRAVDQWRKLIKLDGPKAEYLYNLAKSLSAVGDNEQAAAILREAAESVPDGELKDVFLEALRNISKQSQQDR